MDNTFIKQIFRKASINSVKSIRKITVGFSNDVYSADDKYILKIGRSKEDDLNLKKDIYFCNLLKDKIPTPKIIYADTSHSLIDKTFFIYPKISGDNLYSKWHICNNQQRKRFIEQICAIMRKINAMPYENFAEKFRVNINMSWQDWIYSVIEKSLKTLADKKFLSRNIINQIRRFLSKNRYVLQEQKMALTYWDLHFDNFLVSDDKIVGILDFERTEVASIDYALCFVRRMVQFPKKYASEESEKLIKPEDYSKLLDWYKEFYPELFEFQHLETRLNLYAIQYLLDDIFWYPDVEELKEELIRYLS